MCIFRYPASKLVPKFLVFLSVPMPSVIDPPADRGNHTIGLDAMTSSTLSARQHEMDGRVRAVPLPLSLSLSRVYHCFDTGIPATECFSPPPAETPHRCPRAGILFRRLDRVCTL